MNPGKISGRRTPLLLASLLAGTGILYAADEANTTTAVPENTVTVSGNGTSQNEEIARLKAALAEQQKQLQALQQTVEKEQALLEKAIGASVTAPKSGTFTGIGQVA
jgi:hypothetical protein